MRRACPLQLSRRNNNSNFSTARGCRAAERLQHVRVAWYISSFIRLVRLVRTTIAIAKAVCVW